MYTGEEIKQQREARANNIVKGFSNSDDLLEKAHNHGDVHSNGKWYWESSANGGKGDWRTIKKNKQDGNGKQNEKETKIEMKSINGLTSTQIVAEFKKTFAGEKFSISSSDKPGVYDISYFDNEVVGNGKAAVGVLSIDKSKKKVIVVKEQKGDKVYAKTVDFAERLAKLQKYKIIYA